ncbi:hypothetical protein LYZ37_18160 [Vibrio tubiashii]|uniref:hypothetical protein n=1 Tax=Vibrio tubiashii TaxID=29498 RepID=UPI00234F7BE1|nr:hypothetical protein [Vibrio tubiashii]WCP69933.1 hypothetical protein LYZ37_18160 [Vibrio tubiashii]
MKFSQAVWLFLTGIVGVLFGGLFLGLMLDKFYSGELETGDMATWAAAFGTICTLGFLINQHSQLREEQKKEREEREAHEKKQLEMWVEQKERLSFEKFQTHKTMFNGMLKELEKKFEGEFSFYDIDGLYEKLFPANSFLCCQPKIYLGSESENRAGSLKDALDAYTFLNKNLDDCHKSSVQYYNHAHSYLGNLLSLSSILHVSFKPNSKYGGMYADLGEKDRLFLLNVFSPLRTAVILENVLKRICSFTGNQGEVVTLSHKETSFLFEIIQKFAFKHTNLRGYRFETNGKGSVIYLLNDIKTALSYYRSLSEIPIDTRYSYLVSLFTNEHKMKNLLSSDSYNIHRSLADMAFALKDLRENYVFAGEQSKVLRKLEERATSLQSAYKPHQ